MVKRFDRGKKITFKKNAAGAILIEAYPSRTGIQEYLVDGKIQKEYRSDSEVFSPESLESFLGTVVTINHPPEMVNPDNATQYSVGTVLREAIADNDHTKTLIQVLKSDAIKAVEAGELVELSVGYTADVIPETGEWQGQKYDAVQRNIRVNHIALLPAGQARAGSTARLKLDAKDGIEICDTIEVSENDNPSKKETNMEEEELKALQSEYDKLQAKLDASQDEVKVLQEKIDSIDINLLVKERVELIEQCKKLDKDVDTTLDNESLLRAVVGKSVKLDDNKSVEYVRARFDALLENAEKIEKERADANKAAQDLVSKTKTDKKDDSRSVEPIVFG